MASVFGHGVVAFTISKLAQNKPIRLLLITAILSSILPDIDVLTFKFGVPYEHPFGHRGFTHSILFALLWAGLIAVIFGKSKKLIWFWVIFLSTLSHGLLDALTNGGRGVGFFVPFDEERFFFPWRIIEVSPIYIEDFFSDWGIAVILSEIRYIIIPCFIIFVIVAIFKKYT